MQNVDVAAARMIKTEDADFPLRIKNALLRKKLITLGDIADLMRADGSRWSYKLRNIGAISQKVIFDKLESYGLVKGTYLNPSFEGIEAEVSFAPGEHIYCIDTMCDALEYIYLASIGDMVMVTEKKNVCGELMACMEDMADEGTIGSSIPVFFFHKSNVFPDKQLAEDVAWDRKMQDYIT